MMMGGARPWRHAVLEGGVHVEVGGALVVWAGYGEGDGTPLGAGGGARPPTATRAAPALAATILRHHRTHSPGIMSSAAAPQLYEASFKEKMTFNDVLERTHLVIITRDTTTRRPECVFKRAAMSKQLGGRGDTVVKVGLQMEG